MRLLWRHSGHLIFFKNNLKYLNLDLKYSLWHFIVINELKTYSFLYHLRKTSKFQKMNLLFEIWILFLKKFKFGILIKFNIYS